MPNTLFAKKRLNLVLNEMHLYMYAIRLEPHSVTSCANNVRQQSLRVVIRHNTVSSTLSVTDIN